MKKIITTLSLITISLFTFGQTSMRVLDMLDVDFSNAIYDVSLPTNANITTEMLAYNSDSVAHTYKCRRTIYTVASDDSTQFCWGGLCYNWGTNTSSVSIAINPGDTIDFAAFGFHAIFRSKMSAITRTVHYQFYDISNVNDSTGVTIRYNSVLGVDEVVRGGTISNAYPNPASSMVSMKYDISEASENGQIIFYDMLGKSVKEIVLTDKKGTAKVNVDDLNPGIYFYSFVVDGKAISTKRLVVSYK